MRVGARRVAKPRAILWEWLLLDAKSPLRRVLDEAAATDAARGDTFGFLPDLAFAFSRTGGGGHVERVEVSPLPRLGRSGRRALAGITGRAVALFAWLGVADLHWENLVLGVDRRGQTIFAPLDVEMVLADLSLPTETKLLPDPDPEYADVCRHAAGVRRVLPYLGKPVDVDDLVAMVHAYASTLALLDRHAHDIAEAFGGLPALRTTPIRVCLRGTGDYVRARRGPVWPPLLDAEAEQLARGDIPYFFRLYGKPGIRYYAERSLRRTATLPARGDVPRLDRLLALSRRLRSPSRRTLHEEGLLTLIGAFDHPSFEGRHAHGDVTVTFTRRSLTVKLPSGDELAARRDLQAFVGSVYLPCRCGEVRAPFVPAVTSCDAPG